MKNETFQSIINNTYPSIINIQLPLGEVLASKCMTIYCILLRKLRYRGIFRRVDDMQLVSLHEMSFFLTV